MTREIIQECLDKITALEYYDKDKEMSLFRNDGRFAHDMSVTRCTCSAAIIAQELNGEVFGYTIDDRHSQELFGFWSNGHDFAVVDKYIVDWWLANVDEGGPAILDTTDPDDIKIIEQRYLPREQWETIDWKWWFNKWFLQVAQPPMITVIQK